MQITNLAISAIRPYGKNAKKHDKQQIEQVANSIQAFGWAQPLVVDKNNVLIIGHCRLLAAEKLGLKEVPVVKMENLTPEQVTALRLADNKLNESEWRMELVIPELQGLDVNLLKLTGFDLLDFNEEGEGDRTYTKKITAPIYEPKNEKPDLKDLYDNKKAYQLTKLIQKSDIPDEKKEFLMFAATRLIIFDYEKIADYFAHSSDKTKELMEKLALVIIDFEKAIENGYIEVSKEILKQYNVDKNTQE